MLPAELLNDCLNYTMYFITLCKNVQGVEKSDMNQIHTGNQARNLLFNHKYGAFNSKRKKDFSLKFKHQ